MNPRKETTASPGSQGRLWIWVGKHKKKFWIILLCAVLLAASALVIYTRPRPLINPSGPYLSEPEIYRVELGGEDITDQVDLDELMEILRDATYQRSVFPWGDTTHRITPDLIDIFVRTGYRYELATLLLTPSRQSVWDDFPGGIWRHRIIDGEAVYDALLSSIESSLQSSAVVS